MEELLSLINQFAKTELIILVPVLYVMGKFLCKSKTPNKYIPLLLLGISIVLCGLYVFSTSPLDRPAQWFAALFTSLTQGILYAGAGVFSGVLVNPSSMEQIMKRADGTSSEEKQQK